MLSKKFVEYFEQEIIEQIQAGDPEDREYSDGSSILPDAYDALAILREAAQHRVKNDTPSAQVSGGENSNDGNSQK